MTDVMRVTLATCKEFRHRWHRRCAKGGNNLRMDT
jgi:hypothetical protein